jgi:hypothetical protein
VIRVLADENVPAASIARLRSEGLDVASAAESSPGAVDATLLDQARAEKRLLLTFDRDFGELIYRQGHAQGEVGDQRPSLQEVGDHRTVLSARRATPSAMSLRTNSAILAMRTSLVRSRRRGRARSGGRGAARTVHDARSRIRCL